MDEERERRVWQRVRAQLPIQEAAACAGTLRSLYKYGKARELTARLLQTQMEHLDVLRGIQRRLGRQEPAWVISDPQGDCLGLAGMALDQVRDLGKSYAALSQDEAFGPVFQLMEAETAAMRKDLLRFYSRL